MPRRARCKSASNIYHVVIRGADRQQLFEESKDYIKYLDILQYYKLECEFKLYAYCLMSNHIHLLMKTQEMPLDMIFRHVSTCYAVWFNMKYDRTGFLQQGRYYSEPVEDYEYLLTVSRYIHQNPYKAGLETIPGDSYPWCSLQDYIRGTSPIIDIDEFFNLAGGGNDFVQFNRCEATADCLDIDKLKKRIPDDVARDIIKDVCNCTTVSDFQELSILNRDKYIPILTSKGLSIRQLNRLTGISRGVIQNILMRRHSH